jgi:hypothetical protein
LRGGSFSPSGHGKLQSYSPSIQAQGRQRNRFCAPKTLMLPDCFLSTGLPSSTTHGLLSGLEEKTGYPEHAMVKPKKGIFIIPTQGNELSPLPRTGCTLPCCNLRIYGELGPPHLHLACGHSTKWKMETAEERAEREKSRCIPCSIRDVTPRWPAAAQVAAIEAGLAVVRSLSRQARLRESQSESAARIQSPKPVPEGNEMKPEGGLAPLSRDPDFESRPKRDAKRGNKNKSQRVGRIRNTRRK